MYYCDNNDNVKFFYPDFKQKAVTFSYDDGPMDCDIKIIKILDKYRLKGTFNLIAGNLFRTERVYQKWDHVGQPVFYTSLKRDEIADLYCGHEIANHTYTHRWMADLGRDERELDKEITLARQEIEKVCDYPVTGFAYPGGKPDFYTPENKADLQKRGILYARNAVDSHSFALPQDLYDWHPTCHDWDDNARDVIEKFAVTQQPLALLYVWGHSYELCKPDRNGYENFEWICSVCANNDTWAATNRELAWYINTLYAVTKTQNGIKNNGTQPLYIEINRKKVILGPCSVLDFDELNLPCDFDV